MVFNHERIGDAVVVTPPAVKPHDFAPINEGAEGQVMESALPLRSMLRSCGDHGKEARKWKRV